MRMIAKARNRFIPSVSNIAACVVIRFDKKANRSFIDSGGIGEAPVDGFPRRLRHAIGEHTCARVTGLGAQNSLFFGLKTDVVVDRFGFSVALSLSLDDLLLCERNEQLIGVLAVTQRD